MTTDSKDVKLFVGIHYSFFTLVVFAFSFSFSSLKSVVTSKTKVNMDSDRCWNEKIVYVQKQQIGRELKVVSLNSQYFFTSRDLFYWYLMTSVTKGYTEVERVYFEHSSS